MRLHELTPEQIDEWKDARLKAGRAQYGEAHMQRYGLVDVMEELLDALNILFLTAQRVVSVSANVEAGKKALWAISRLESVIEVLLREVLEVDAKLPDEACTDELGSERIWWSEQAGERRAG